MNFKDLQQSLQTDASLREQLAKDPVKFFEDRGIILSQEMGDSLKKDVEKVFTPKQTVSGSSLAAQANTTIVIQIKIPF